MTDPTRAELSCDDIRDMAGSFVLGALAEADAAAVRSHLASCADAHAEIEQLGSVLPALDASVAQVEPPAKLKARILAAAAAEPQAGRARDADIGMARAEAPVPVPSTIPVVRAEDRTAPRATSRLDWGLRIAAIFVIVVLGGWNLLLQAQVSDAQRFEQDVATVLAAAREPGSLAAILTPDAGPGSGIAAVTSNGQLSLAMQDLAPTSGDEVYETWAIAADGVPVALGSFSVGRGGTAFFMGVGVPATDGIVLALTLEPGPGATAPTGPVVSKGVAASAG